MFKEVRPEDYELPSVYTKNIMTPALVVHLEKVRENLRRMIAYVGDPKRWRPHMKTTKIPAVWAEAARAGITKFKVATTREAAVLSSVLVAEDIAGDILVAYPLAGPSLRRLSVLAKQHPTIAFSVLCEDCDAVAEVPANVSIFVDVNPAMNRTGIHIDETPDQILKVAKAADSFGGRFRGIHFYEGHLLQGEKSARTAAAHACYDKAMTILRRIEDNDLSVRELITSGTPAFSHALTYQYDAPEAAPMRGHNSMTQLKLPPGSWLPVQRCLQARSYHYVAFKAATSSEITQI